jgi:hypothetical protein
MTSGYLTSRRPGRAGQGVGLIDEFMSWLLFGRETWVVALLKGVPLFLFVYFLLTYVPNYVYYLTTQYIFRFSDDVGFLFAAMVGGGNFALIIVLAMLAQASRGRRGPGWTLLRVFLFLNLLFILLLLIPLLAFNLAGGTFVPAPVFTLPAIAFGMLVAGMGAAALVYLYLEFRRITRQDAEAARRASAGYAAS